jgi:AraC-like DNA-binding protein
MVAVSQHIFNGRTAASRWHHTIEDLFGTGENFIGDDLPFCGNIRHGALGQIEISNVTSSREISRRTRRHVNDDSRDTYVLVNGVSGDVSLQQGTTRTQIVPRSFVYYCASRPYEWRHMNMTEVRNIAVPGHLLKARLRNVDQYAGRSFTDTSGMWRILADIMDSSLHELEAIPEAASHQLGAQIGDLLALTLEGDGRLSLTEASSRNGIYRRCLGVIRGNIIDDDLGPELIASAVGLSVRSLHRLFAENGTAVTECIREERLAASLTQLENAGSAEISISEIAHRIGFRSHSHFSHAFRTKFGMTPTDWRRRQN